MGLQESHNLKGQLSIVSNNLEGKTVYKNRINNLITNAGRKLLAEYMIGRIDGQPELYVAVGTGDEPADKKDTSLTNQVAKVKVMEDSFLTRYENDEVNVTLTATLPPAEEGQEELLKEAGVLITLQDGSEVLYNKTVFPVVTRTDKLKITLSWDLKF